MSGLLVRERGREEEEEEEEKREDDEDSEGWRMKRKSRRSEIERGEGSAFTSCPAAGPTSF